MVSIIVPVYKVEAYLSRCLDSIIAQSYAHLEIICVNDGSPDNCLSILEEYAARDPRIKIINQQNRGLSAARNAALDIATGRYVMFIDSDDWVDPDMAEVLVRTLEEHGADIANCQYDMFRADGQIEKSGWAHAPLVLGRKEALRLLLEDSQLTSHVWRNLFRKELFDDLRFPEGKVYEDRSTTPKIFLKAERIVLIENELYHYFLNEHGIVCTESLKTSKNAIEAYMSLFDTLGHMPDLLEPFNRKLYDELYRARRRYLTRLARLDEDGSFVAYLEEKISQCLSMPPFSGSFLRYACLFHLHVVGAVEHRLYFLAVWRYRLLATICSGKKKEKYLKKLRSIGIK